MSSLEDNQIKPTDKSKQENEEGLSMQNLDAEFQKQFSKRLALLQEKTGMKKVQEAITSESTKSQVEKKRFFDRFHSSLRYFNANAPTNSFKSGIIAPSINFMGRVLNFANDEDCEIVSELFTSRKKNARSAFSMLGESKTWKALFKVGGSSLGAVVRGTASVANYGLEVIFSPVRTWNNLKAAAKAAWDAPRFEGVGAFFKNVNRHYQLIEPKEPPSPTILSEEDKSSVKTLTLNAGLLRDWFWTVFKDKDKNGKQLPFNKLRPPRERALELAEGILKIDEKSPRDVLCMQEVFDNLAYLGLGKDAQMIVIDKLKEKFPYVLYDVGHRGYPFVSSGLIVFSKYPIVDAEFHRYPNLAGLDSLSNKGFVAAKIKKGDRFFTVYNTHTQATRGGFTKWMEVLTRKTKKLPTSGECRGEELGLLNEHMQQWAHLPPPQAKNRFLGHLDTYLMGDLNQGLNDKDKVFGISHGKQKSREQKPIKYKGQYDLMHNISVRLADNFVDYRIHTERIHVMKNLEDDSHHEIVGIKFKEKIKDKENEADKFTLKDIDTDSIKDWKKIEIDNNGKQVMLPLTDQEIRGFKSLVEDALNPKDDKNDNIKIKNNFSLDLFRKKGEHPTKRKLFEYERNKMIRETISDLTEKFPNIPVEVIQNKVHQQFQVLSASIINDKELVRSLGDGSRESNDEDITAREKYVDINASALFDRQDKLRERGLKAKDRTCLLFTPKGKDGRVFTDHAGMVSDFSYEEARSENSGSSLAKR